MEEDDAFPTLDSMKQSFLDGSSLEDESTTNKVDNNSSQSQPSQYNKDFLCVFCKKKFTTKKYLRSHIKTIHESSRVFLCPLCGKQLAREKGLQQHLRTIHEGKWSVYCNLCGKGFINQCRLKKHTRSVHERERRLNCTICGKLFQNEIARRYHISNEHSVVSPKSEEPREGYNESDSQTSESSRSPPTPTIQPLVQSENMPSGNSFVSVFDSIKSSLSKSQSVTVQKSSIPTEIRCLFCQAKFESIQKLMFHLILTHNDNNLFLSQFMSKMREFFPMDEEDTFKIKEFDSHPFSIANLTKNDRLNVTKNDSANIENKFIGDSEDLVKISFNNGFCCQSCGKRFPDRLSLRQHKSAFHKVSGPRYQCSHCNKTFATKEYQKLHEATVHEGTKCFSCTTCGKNFSVQQALRKHIIIQHEGGKPYRCSTCKMCFRSRANMTQHRSQAHNIPMTTTTSSTLASSATSIANKLLMKYQLHYNTRHPISDQN